MKTTNQPADLEDLQEFLMCAKRDASGRAGTPFDRTPLTTAFAESERELIGTLHDLVTTDDQARSFVRRWRALVENASPDEFPQCRCAVFAKTDDVTWTIGAQLVRSAVTLWDAFVRDEIVEAYRVLGTVVED